MTLRRLAFALFTAMILAPGAGARADVKPESATVETMLASGGRALDSGSLDEAEELFTAVLDAATDDDDRALAELGLARIAELRGDLTTALLHARHAEEVAPDDAGTVFFVGRLLAALGTGGEAVEQLQRARELAPMHPSPPLLAALVLREEGEVEEALQLLEDAWASGISAPAVAEQIGALSLTLNRPQRTIEISREILAVSPELAEFHFLLGLALARDPDSRADAISSLRRALALGAPDPGLASLELGILLLAERDPEAALAALREAEELMPDNPEVYYRQAAAFRLAGDRESATRAIQRFQQLRTGIDERDSEAKRLGTELNRAFSLIDDNRLEEALEVLDGIIAAAPNNARVQASRAKVLHSMGRIEDALAAAARAREIDPSRSEHHLLEGILLLALGRLEEAEAAERQALALDPDLAQAHVLLGGALAKQDRAEEAARHFQIALDLGADTPPLRLGYAAVLETLGRLEESEEQMAAYRRLKEAPAAGNESETTPGEGEIGAGPTDGEDETLHESRGDES